MCQSAYENVSLFKSTRNNLVIIVQILSNCTAVRCSFSPFVENAVVLFKTFGDFDVEPQEGSSVVFTCLPGFHLSGNAVVTCSTDGTWSKLPLCIEHVQTCGALPKLNNSVIHSATFSQSSAVPGDSFKVSCKDGYVLDILDQEVVCKISGEWSHIPQCVSKNIGCGPIPKIQNVAVNFTNVRGEASQIGDVVFYQCLPDFEPVGSLAIICSGDGQWAPNIPYCRSRNANRCASPPAIRNGNVMGTIEEWNQPGTKVTYSCLPGYVLDGSGIGECLKGGFWDVDVTCEPVAQSCGLFPFIEHATEIDRNFGNFEPGVPGSFVAIACPPGFFLQGPSRIECLETGQWTAPLPRCASRPASTFDITCGITPTVKHGIVTFSTLPNENSESLVGDSVMYGCEEGYEISGYPGTTCTKEGVWSNTPVCSSVHAKKCSSNLGLIFVLDFSKHIDFSNEDSWVIGNELSDFATNLEAPFVGVAIGSYGEANYDFNNATYLVEGVDPQRYIEPGDLNQLFSTIRTKIIPKFGLGTRIKLIHVTNSPRVKSFALVEDEMFRLKHMDEHDVSLFVLSFTPRMSESNLQQSLRSMIASEGDFFLHYPTVDDFLNYPFDDEDIFNYFLCQV